jgi:hypothetical protein
MCVAWSSFSWLHNLVGGFLRGFFPATLDDTGGYSGILIININHYFFAGWWLTYPSAKMMEFVS